MVHHANLAEVRRVYEPYVGKADVLSMFQVPDTDEALRMARLRPGENVLDLGTCSGRVIAEAKRCVGSGVCVGVDGVAGFLDVDVEARLNILGLTRAPAGKDDKNVYLLTAGVTQTNLPIRIQECVGRTAANPIRFDVIFAVHVFPAIDPRHRLQALQLWKSMLVPSGRIVLNLSPVFAPRSSTTQFTLDATEAPGCVFAARYDLGIPMPLLVGGKIAAKPTVIAAAQMSPDWVWTEGRQQAEHAAGQVKMRVVQSVDIGKGNMFGLTHNGSSPPAAELEGKTGSEIRNMISSWRLQGFQCRGRLSEALVEATTTFPSPVGVAERRYLVVRGLQDVAEQYQKSTPLDTEAWKHQCNFTQAGVLVELRAKE